MRKEQKLIDFRIKTSNSEIPCHKLILAAQSDYFEGMFQYEDNESDLEGILDPKALEIVVEYFYTGIMQFEFDTAIHVFKVLDFLQVKNNILKESLFNYICKNLTIDLDNCVEWYIFGDQFDKNVIKDKALHTMVEQVCNIVEGDEIRALSFNQLTDYIIGILTQNNIDREMAKWAAEKWISYDVTRQEKSQTLSIMIERAQKTPIQMAMDVWGTMTSLDICFEFPSWEYFVNVVGVLVFCTENIL